MLQCTYFAHTTRYISPIVTLLLIFFTGDTDIYIPKIQKWLQPLDIEHVIRLQVNIKHVIKQNTYTYIQEQSQYTNSLT